MKIILSLKARLPNFRKSKHLFLSEAEKVRGVNLNKLGLKLEVIIGFARVKAMLMLVQLVVFLVNKPSLIR